MLADVLDVGSGVCAEVLADALNSGSGVVILEPCALGAVDGVNGAF